MRLVAAWGGKTAVGMGVQRVDKEKMKRKMQYSKGSIVLRGNALTCFDAASATKADVSKRSMKGSSRKTHLWVQTLRSLKTFLFF